MGKTGQAAATKLERYARTPSARMPATTSPASSPPSEPDRQAVGDPASPTLAQILQAISDSEQRVTGRIAEVQADLATIKHDMQQIHGRMDEAEHRISALEDLAGPIRKDLDQLISQVEAWRAKSTDLEGRLRRNNVRFVGFPEKMEGTDTVRFLKEVLIKEYGRDSFSAQFDIERAHRLPPQPPRPGAPPRTIIAKLLNYRDRDSILNLTRQQGPIKLGNASISAYPDFAADVQKSRALFLPVKRRLREHHLPYAMLFPAKLRVNADGTSHFFGTPQDASEWLDKRVERRSPSTSHS